MPRGWRRRALAVLGAAFALVALAHPLAAASDVWGNVGPASGLGGLSGRYPLGNYALDEHFTAVSAGVFSGVDVSGVPPMIAYFLADVLWQLTSWLASVLIDLFSFAFSLDLVNGSEATGGAGALGSVAAAIHSIYASTFGAPWLVVAVAIAGLWAMWKALVQRRYSETAGSLALSLIYVTAALFFVAQPAQTVGVVSHWTNRVSTAFLAISRGGSPSHGDQARQAGADQLFSLLVYQPWVALEFGGTEHCVKAGTGSSDADPVSVPVRPLPASASRRLRAGEQISSEGKVCVNNVRRYAPHFLRFAPGSDERGEEYEALNDGDSSKLPDADPGKASYELGVADKPATDAMEQGGQYQRLLLAIVVFVGELGAFMLLGALAVGVILAQVLLLLWLAFAPFALVAAAIPGRGHDFFRGWISKLAGFALRKAAYSLILAVLLAVCAALSSATSQLGWLMSFGLQALLFWTVFVQRRSLSESLIGVATGPSAPGREGALRVLALYYGARTVVRPARGAGRRAGAALRGAASRVPGGRRQSDAPSEPSEAAEGGGAAAGAGRPAQRRGGAAVQEGERAPGGEPARAQRPARESEPPRGGGRWRRAGTPEDGDPPPARRTPKGGAQPADETAKAEAGKRPDRDGGDPPKAQPPASRRSHGPADTAGPSPAASDAGGPGQGESPLDAELRADRERSAGKKGSAELPERGGREADAGGRGKGEEAGDENPPPSRAPRPRRRRLGRGGRGR